MSEHEQKIVERMISFIEDRERQYQQSKLVSTSDQQAKNDVVKSILDELERAISDENNQN